MKYKHITPKYRLIPLIILLSVSILTWINFHQDLRLVEGEKHYVNLIFPLRAEVTWDPGEIIQVNDSYQSFFSREEVAISLEDSLSPLGMGQGKASLEIKLFGLIPVRQINIDVLPEKKVYVGGQSIGIKLRSEGVMVVGYNEVGGTSPAREGDIRKGDSIIAINGTKVKNLDQVAGLINKETGPGIPVVFSLKRQQEKIIRAVIPRYCRETGSYRVGLFIRDTAAGVGTLTFYDPQSKAYGALGHVIVDIDTNQPIEIEQGEIVKASIINIREGRRGHPGEKTGVFIEGKDIIGSIEKNSEFGIFGALDKIDNKNSYYKEPVPVAWSHQVETGPAEILTVIKGDRIERFSAEIKRIVNPSLPDNKGFILKITDPKLLKETGGIIQGMSGSPVMQGQRLVGAVNHVFVNDPTRGYGVFIEWMLQELQKE